MIASINRKKCFLFLSLILLLISLVLLTFIFGQYNIPFSLLIKTVVGEGSNEIIKNILFDVRLPVILVATFVGGGLAVTGGVMQSFFRNPLADPYILGIQGGASLGMAFWIFLYQSLEINSLPFNLGHVFFAAVGSLFFLLIILFLVTSLENLYLVIIIGVILNYLASSIINLLVAFSSAAKIKSFVLWNLGGFSRVSTSELIFYLPIVGLLILILFMLSKKLNLLLLGKDYAVITGLNFFRFKIFLLVILSVLTALFTILCGPIVFVGMLAPQLTRMIFKSFNHLLLLPANFLVGAIFALAGYNLANNLFSMPLPLNAVLGILGVPLILFFLIRGRWGISG